MRVNDKYVHTCSYMYVCVYVCVYICIYIYIFIIMQYLYVW